ncbi:helix-turn-helix domain-containing protein [Pseudomarimonas arenosa]|uniref:Helix-turn-helix domain-containing protein n=1 Tax=Pseudomarimonas arenosa TaxID=2774145 RepID=A0AAW3ZSU9_9GAMM|nr:helix-turn-helix domain-containing protein [Pseudomarimonas arenosa]MBD8527271.1 helix-turn-helix domain-containing protein [Pseudomarimonas arenosa]
MTSAADPLTPLDMQLLREFDNLSDTVLLSSALTAHLLGVAQGTLRNWRAEGKPPPFVSFGKTSPVRYRAAALRAFIHQHEFASLGHEARAQKLRKAGLALDIPVLPEGKRRSNQPTVMGFLGAISPETALNDDDVWPFVLDGLTRRPLDILTALTLDLGPPTANEAEQEAVWLTRSEYGRALIASEEQAKTLAQEAALRALGDALLAERPPAPPRPPRELL